MVYDNLVTGLKILAVGLPGVFLNLGAVALLLRLVGWAVARLETDNRKANNQ